MSTKIYCSCLICKKEIMSKYLNYHIKNHNKPIKKYICKQCGKEHDKKQPFCSHSCAAKYSNTNRKSSSKGKTKTLICSKCNNEYIGSIHTSLTKSTCKKCKIQEKNNKILENKNLYKEIYCLDCNKPMIVLKTNKKRKCSNCYKKSKTNKKIIPKILGEFTKISYCTCKHCGKKFIHKTQKQYCSDHKTFSSNKRSFYKFSFNIFDYPDLFDLELLKKVGFYGPGGKSKRWNKQGLSRDHIISISDAIKYNYDPYYISHPLNCNLIPWEENNKKKTQSLMDYEELIQKINNYDSCRDTINTLTLLIDRSANSPKFFNSGSGRSVI